MNQIPSLFQSEWMKALGWTFVHSLWQIALIGLLLFIILRLIPGRSAHMRYSISTLALWLILVMALATFIVMLPDTRVLTEVSGKLILTGAQEPVSLTDKISAWLEVRMPMMLTIWSGGVALLMIRLAISLMWVRHIRQTAMPEEALQTLLNHLIRNLKLNVRPGAASTSLTSSPVTIGHLKPLILFPVGIINQLSPKEVEAILTHELAHIVRRDYLSNLIQSFIETLFYYHPITWWISGMVRTERENRADDLAVSWCGDHLAYAKTLMTVQEMQVRQGPSLAIGFSSRKGAMLARIQRILHLPYKNHNQMEKTVLLSLSTLCFLAFTLTSHTMPDQAEKNEKQLTVTVTTGEEMTDSIPSTDIYRIHKKTDDQDITIEVENGDIRELKVDGKEIQPSEFEAYGNIIDELFGVMEAPPTMEAFQFAMPGMPEMPEMPELAPIMEGFEFNFEFPEMPEMPEMPEIPQIDIERFFLHDPNIGFNEENGQFFSLINPGQVQIICDSTNDGNVKIIVINGGDSSVICTPHYYGSGMSPEQLEQFKMDKDMMKAYSNEWRAQADQWREQQQQLREQFRAQAEQQRAEQQYLREKERNQYRWTEEQGRAMERELSLLDELKDIYVMGWPRLSLSEEMVKDGLVQPGAEVEVQLTPEKLKINGEKMPEAIHQKYLELYEQQQGVELSGNSRVEFTTKSKQRM